MRFPNKQLPLVLASFLLGWIVGISLVQQVEAQGGGRSTPRECSALASTSDYGTIIGPSIAALEAASHQMSTLDSRCPDRVFTAERDPACQAEMRTCRQFYEANIRQGGYDAVIVRFREMSALIAQPVGGQHFEVPADWARHHLVGMQDTDCMTIIGFAERSARMSDEANFLRQTERTYQQWWDWVRGLCHMTR